MDKFFGIVTDTIVTLIGAVIMAALICITYVIVLPVIAILNSVQKHVRLSESYMELHELFIDKISGN